MATQVLHVEQFNLVTGVAAVQFFCKHPMVVLVDMSVFVGVLFHIRYQPLRIFHLVEGDNLCCPLIKDGFDNLGMLAHCNGVDLLEHGEYCGVYCSVPGPDKGQVHHLDALCELGRAPKTSERLKVKRRQFSL